MQAAADPLDVVYVTAGERTTDRTLTRTERLRVTLAGADEHESWPAPEQVDCLVLGRVADGTLVEAVERLRQRYPSTPLVAFTGERDGNVERVLDAGASDLIQSSPADTPDALVQRRVENVCERTAIAPATQTVLDGNDNLFEHLSQNLRDVIWINNPHRESGDEMEFVSAAYEEVWGRPREYALQGGTEAFLETVHPEDRERVLAVSSRAWRASATYEVTYRIVRPDGETRWIHDRALGVQEDGETRRIVGIARDITERKERERRLERQNDLFTKAQDIADVGAWEYTVDSDTENIWTEQLYDIFGAPGDIELTLENARQFYHPDDWPDIEAAIERALTEGEPFDREVRLGSDGEDTQWARLRGDPQSEDGSVVRVRGTLQDITEHRERERDLERSREFLEQIQNIGDVGGWEHDLETGHLRLTDQACAVLGLPSGSTLTPAEVREYFHPDDRQDVREGIEQLQATGEPFDIEVRVAPEQTDGETRWVAMHGEPVYENGEVVAARGVSRDVTDRVERERQLQAERDLVERILETSPVGIVVHDTDGDIVSANEQAARTLGLESERLQAAGAPPEELRLLTTDGERLPRSEIPRVRVEETGEPVRDRQIVLVTPAGEQVTVVVDAVPLFEDGDLKRTVVTFEDITDRVEREQQLQAERDLVERIIETSPVGIVVHDADGEIISANERVEETLGIARGRLEEEGQSPESMNILDADVEWCIEDELLVEHVSRTGESVHDREFVVETPAGERVVLLVSGVPLVENGRIERVVVTLEDVTDRVERENRLERQRNELARLDRLNRTIRDVHAALVGARTREEIARAVCNRLSASGRYAHALLFGSSGDGLELQAARGDGPSTVHADALDAIPDDGPVMRAMATGDAYAVRDIGDSDVQTMCEAVDDICTSSVTSMAAVPVSYDGGTHEVLAVCGDREGAFDERELDVLDELGGTTGYAIAAAESREREATLASLYEATQDLLTAESTDEVCSTVVETAASVLDPPGIGIFLFDADENALTLATGTDAMQDFFDEVATFGPDHEDSITWQTYVSGEPQFLEDVHESDSLANTGTDARSSLLLPLGDHGVFVVATPERVRFSEQKRRLVGLLAASTEAALDRVAGQKTIRERDRRLSRHTERLERFERQFELLESVEGVLQDAGTRESIERRVCEQLVETGPHALAWIGTVPPDGDTVDPRVWANGKTGTGPATEQGYLDDVSLATDGAEPAASAAATGEPVSVSNVTARLRDADWTHAALEHDYQSVLAVPLVHGEVTYGVLAVYATETDAFDDVARPGLATLGRRVARAINTAERERAVLAGSAVELELSVSADNQFPNAVAATVDESVEYREVTPARDGRTRILFTLPESAVDDVRALQTEFVGVDSVEVADHSERAAVRVTLAGPTLATTLLECGALPGRVVATPSETTATVRLPQGLDVRAFLDRLSEHCPDAELRSRQNVKSSAAAAETARRALDEDLTDRQQEVLQSAYESGFFESPRETTGVELAEDLDVSQPTVAHHLREAQRRLLDSLLGD